MERGCCHRDHMLVGFSTTCAISAYHHLSCEFKPCSWWGVLDTTLCEKVCQWRDRPVVFSGYSGFLHQQNWPPRYSWNIVESGVKHHQPTNLECISCVKSGDFIIDPLISRRSRQICIQNNLCKLFPWDGTIRIQLKVLI